MPKRPITPTYIAFYILFFPDTWRILAGAGLSVLLVPQIDAPNLSPAGRAMLYVMVSGIGWAITASPARWLTRWLKTLILGGKAR